MHKLQARIEENDKDWIAQNIDKINDELISITNGINSIIEEAKLLSSKLGIQNSTQLIKSSFY